MRTMLEKRNFTFVNEDGDGDYFVLGFRVYGIIFWLFLGFRVYGFIFSVLDCFSVLGFRVYDFKIQFFCFRVYDSQNEKKKSKIDLIFKINATQT